MAPTIARRVPAVTFAANAPPLMSPLRPLAAKLQQLVDRIDPQAGRYRMLFESSPLPMWVLADESMRFVAGSGAPPRAPCCPPEGCLQPARDTRVAARSRGARSGGAHRRGSGDCAAHAGARAPAFPQPAAAAAR